MTTRLRKGVIGLAGALTALAATSVSALAQTEAAAPVADKGDTAWMLTATALVVLMTIPGLALFYGGLVRAKNMLSVLMQVFYAFSVVSVLWVLYGYSLTFTGGSAAGVIGGFSKAMLAGVGPGSLVETFSKGVYIPELAFVAFQMTFAAITPGLIVGSIAERVRFPAMALLVPLWSTLVYMPIAHMVWFWGGPSAASDPAGYLYGLGALDFAGGTVVHINAGIAGLVGALLVGKRVGYRSEAMAPHSLTMTLIGAALLWVGWFGFNAGSALEANGVAALAVVNTFVATAAAALSWLLVEVFVTKRGSLLGIVTGAVAGLVAITPAAGLAGPGGALVLGLAAGAVCFYFCSTIKNRFGYDDALDVFGVHCVGGILGAIGTGIVADPALGGAGIWDYAANAAGTYSMASQVGIQVQAVAITLLWSGLGSAVLFKLVDILVGLRVETDEEREGLDLVDHGERAYNY
ncbi:MAG: ammonium transporter [Hyphomicrobiaceae bacterium]